MLCLKVRVQQGNTEITMSRIPLSPDALRDQTESLNHLDKPQRLLSISGNAAYKSRMTMRPIRYLLLISAIFAICSGVALGKGWRGIVPLRSTRSDVEKLLGPAPGWNYDLEKEAVHFEYQTPETECGKEWGYWNVPVNTVLGIIVASKERKSIVEWGVDSTYVKIFLRPVANFDYYNEDEGITFGVSGDIVGQITYAPAREDWILACPGRVIKSRRKEN